jgi:hypothetical protein
MFSRRIVIAASGALALPGHGAARAAVRFASAQEEGDPRFTYASRLLSMALDRGAYSGRLRLLDGMTQLRQVRELLEDRLDVGLLPSCSTAAEQGVLAVKAPIRHGLLGLRLLLARREHADEIARVSSLAQLQQRYTLGHGADWGDLGLMRRAGFRVVTSATYSGLFRMLEAERFDLMSRGVSEVWDELDRPRLAGNGCLAVVPGIALFYPLDDYFWVNPARPDLAQAIEIGLRRARSDGSFDALFRKQYQSALRKAELSARRIFKLPLPDAGAAPALFDVLKGFQLEGATP